MRTFGAFIVAIAFGFGLSGAGFTSWDEVNRMFRFAELRLTLGFGMAVFLLVAGWYVLGKVMAGSTFKSRPIHKGSLIGGLLFGAGWALSGGCPSIALAQLGQGQLLAIATLGGIVVGNYAYAVIHAKYFNWTIGSCMDD
jgi:uncharacterized membrane protein YedE/YeeE